MYYSSFGMLAIVLHFIINFEVLRMRRTGNDDESFVRYKHFLNCVLIYYVVDVLWGTLYASRIIPLTYIDTVIYFFTMALSVLLWTRYVVAFLNRKTVFSKVLIYSGWAIFTFTIINLIINLFTPIFFGFDENKVYCPGDVRYISLAIQVLLFLGTSIYTLIVAGKLKGMAKHHHVTIGCSGLVMTVFIVLQTLYPLLPFYSIGCLVATCLIHTFIISGKKAAFEREIGSAKQKAYTDSLTGVKNVHAYTEAKFRLDQLIKEKAIREFGVVVFDLNGLKTINDTLGHDEGDTYIKSASNIICKQFKHSPVYRIGGDEFVVILQNEDYESREELFESFDEMIEKNQWEGKVVISSGMAIFHEEEGDDYTAVFERADHRMYERKKELKAM